MTRRVVATENQSPYPGVFFKPGCFKSGRDGRMPIYFQTYDGALFGSAEDFQRDEATGEISYDIKIQREISKTDPETGRTSTHFEFQDAEENELEVWHFSVYAKDLVEHKDGDTRIIEDALIVGMYVAPLAAIPMHMAKGLKKASHESQG
jgi:hypothetical protein